MKTPLGCDTFVAYPPVAPPGTVVFGKNSDRPTGERQSIRRYPAATHGSSAMVHCTYLAIPQAPQTHAVLLSQIDWMWGAENGANEHGVVIGNEAVWTRVPQEERQGQHLLLGMDLVRLGLERSATAAQAVEVITTLLQQHGQGGACAENDPSFTYHNSFLIADATEAWILETAGRHWVAQRIGGMGARNISNGLTIRTAFDRASDGIREYAKQHRLWNGNEPFDFAKCFSAGGIVDDDDDSRQACGAALLQKHRGTLTARAMMAILRDHDSGICMHGGGFETTASMVTEWKLNTSNNKHASASVQHWMTGQPNPCQCEFTLQPVALAKETG